MLRVALLLTAVAVATARPQPFGVGGAFGHFQHQVPGVATGQAQGTVVTGNAPGASITQVGAAAGGQAAGNAISSNSASASNQQLSTVFGNQQSSNTNAQSNQQTFGGTSAHFGTLGGGLFGGSHFGRK